MERILVDRLQARCIIGTDFAERQQPQTVVITLRIEADLERATTSDSLTDTIDYRRLCQRIIDRVESSSFFLLEALASAIAQVCLEYPAVSTVVVRVEKPDAVPAAASISVELTRKRQVN